MSNGDCVLPQGKTDFLLDNTSNEISGCLKELSKHYLIYIRQAIRLDIIIANYSLLIVFRLPENKLFNKNKKILS
ncbi:MAG: hypothetical protein J6U05_01495 [Neisseriaceae bacterium]|nr:hypothetical protein [Neisseriaceae bacterium]